MLNSKVWFAIICASAIPPAVLFIVFDRSGLLVEYGWPTTISVMLGVFGCFLAVFAMRREWVQKFFTHQEAKRSQGDVRRHAAEIVNEWAAFIARCGSLARPLVVAFLKRYIDEEVRDISGKAQGQGGKHIVVTNFVAYSSYVKEIIDSAIKNRKGRDVVCFTTLTMPVCRWFNFAIYHNADAEKLFPYYQIEDDWDKYTKSLRSLVGNSSGSHDFNFLSLRRCMLIADDDLALANRSNPKFPFHGFQSAKRFINHWILVPAPNGFLEMDKLEAVTKEEYKERLGPAWSEMKGQLTVYREYAKRRFYLIVDPESAQATDTDIESHAAELDSSCWQPPDVKGHKWERVGQAFIDLFHSNPAFENALYQVLSQRHWDGFFNPDRRSLAQRAPVDLFIVGYRDSKLGHSSAPEWALCLAADVDQGLDRLSLEIISEESNPDRWRIIKDYVKTLYYPTKDAGQLSDLVDHHAPVDQ